MTDPQPAATDGGLASSPDDGASRVASASGDSISGRVGGDLDLFEDEVTVRLPAHSIYIGVLRSAVAAVAARADFTVDDIEDLRIAVDEACALLLGPAVPGAVLSCHVSARADSVAAAVSTTVSDPTVPDPTSFGWLVLSALAGAVEAVVDGDTMTIMLSRSRTA